MAALKGAFINMGAGLLGALPNIIVFQFNPDRMTRTPTIAQPPPPSNGSGSRDAQQQPGNPSESFSFTLRIDATDQLARGNPLAAASGILPTLSALELLMVPQGSLGSALSSALSSLTGSSSSEAHKNPPARLPVTLFIWGPFRVLPVNITSLSITETEYDQLLNPIRAEVSVGMQVLTPSQLAKDATIARGAYTYSMSVKEAMAALNLANAVEFGVSASLSISF